MSQRCSLFNYCRSSSDSDSPNYMTKRGNIRGRGVRTRGGKIGGHGVRIRGGKVCSSLNEVNTSESEEDILEISGLSNILNELEVGGIYFRVICYYMYTCEK